MIFADVIKSKVKKKITLYYPSGHKLNSSILKRNIQKRASNRPEAHVKTEAEMRAMQPQAKVPVESPVAGTHKEGFSLGAF